ncbi:MAG: hypothetical protein NT009_01590 [Proteobacteria bacterium]|nr:hypothetical protein [Pseudomonadota bacterium]
MGKKKIFFVFAITLFLVTPLVFFGCSGSKGSETGETPVAPADSPALPARGYFKGILPIPAAGQEIANAYAQASQSAEFVPVWESGVGASGFWDYADALESGSLVKSLVRGNGMFPIVHFSFIDKNPATGSLALKSPGNLPNATLSDPAWRAAYKKAVLDAVKAVKPRYLSVGNEVNRWYEQYGAADNDGNGFQHFVSLYEEIYDAVKTLSPDTLVFCVFAREIVDELREADLGVLEMFDPARLDLLVFTSYPHSVRKDKTGAVLAQPHNRPSDIPDDYYARALTYVAGKPLGFSEIAWPALDFYGGEQAQADFLSEVTGRLTINQGVNLRLLGWPWLSDLDANDSIGLLRRDGTEKTIYQAWKNL